MTTGLITGFSSISELTNVVNSASNVAADNANSFADALKNSTEKKSETVETKKTAEQNKTEDNVKNQDAEAESKEVKSEEKKEISKDTKSADGSEKEEKVSDDIMAAAVQMVGVVAEVLDVTPDDVEDALDALELTEVALLDTTKIPEIVVEVTDVEDTMAIMTDENLYEDVKNITGQIAEVLDELETSIEVPAQEIKDEISKFSVKEETPQLVTEDVAATEAKPEITVEKSEQRDNSGSENRQDGQMNWTETVMDTIKEVTSEAVSETDNVYQTNMEEIYEQVSESLKLNLSKEVTEMEINLHPASLGNVKIQIASKDGVVTANFTTQNEAVKAALETQIIQLKENMAEQGIKVGAIEIAVATHAFEENLSKEGENKEADQKTNKKRRSININELSEDDDINIDDAEAIARDMMIKNGTTVDYMA